MKSFVCTDPFRGNEGLFTANSCHKVFFGASQTVTILSKNLFLEQARKKVVDIFRQNPIK